MGRNYVVGAGDATTSVPADPSAAMAGKTVKVPAEADAVDIPKAFIEFVNSLPSSGAALSSAAPQAAGVAAAGTSMDAARADHVHPEEVPNPTVADNGKVLTVTAGAAGWATPAATVVASTVTPLADAATAVVGTDTGFARGDHVHPTHTVTPTWGDLKNGLSV